MYKTYIHQRFCWSFYSVHILTLLTLWEVVIINLQLIVLPTVNIRIVCPQSHKSSIVYQLGRYIDGPLCKHLLDNQVSLNHQMLTHNSSMILLLISSIALTIHLALICVCKTTVSTSCILHIAQVALHFSHVVDLVKIQYFFIALTEYLAMFICWTVAIDFFESFVVIICAWHRIG